MSTYGIAKQGLHTDTKWMVSANKTWLEVRCKFMECFEDKNLEDKTSMSQKEFK